MPVEYWVNLGYVILCCTTIVFVVSTCEQSAVQPPREPILGRQEQFVAWTIIGFGIFLRIFFLPEFQGGKLTSDESLVSIAYNSGIVHGEPIRVGAGKLIHLLVLDAWLNMVGLSVIKIRLLSTLISVLGLAIWYLSLRTLSGNRIALWATALLSISAFGVFFGRLGFELFWVTFFSQLCLLIYALWVSRPTTVTAAIGGSVAALGLFTYPGFLVALIAVSCGLALSWLITFWSGYRSKIYAKPNRNEVIGMATAFVTFLAVAAYMLYLHETVYAPPSDSFIFGGAGSLSLSVTAIISALKQMLSDLFVAGSSWYLLLKDMPFVEIVLWPFFIAGVLISLQIGKGWIVRGIIFSIPAVIVLAALTGAYPGMRRASYFLLPFYFFSAVGIVRFLDASKASKKRTLSVIMPSILVIALAHPLYYQFTYGRVAVSWNAGEGYGARKIPMEFLLETLVSKDVILSQEEIGKYFDHHIYKHYPRLSKRYGMLAQDARDVHFIEDENDPIISSLGADDKWVFLSWKMEKIIELANRVSVCIDINSMIGGRYPIIAYLYIPRSEKEESFCIVNGKFAGLDAKVELGFRHRKERYVHQVECEDAYCDASRTEFLYTGGGRVSFFLAPEEGACAEGCDIVFQLVNPNPERKCQVFVSNERVGALSMEALDHANKARFAVPPRLLSGEDSLHVSITPEPGDFLGWDIQSAEIVSTGI